MARLHQLTKGLDLPLAGAPEQKISPGKTVERVALLPRDHPGIEPRLVVEEGDVVQRGSLLFRDARHPGLCFTSPGAGRVLAIHRGARRLLLSVVVEVRADEDGREGQVSFESYLGRPVDELEPQQIRALLLESGLWTSLRERPFGVVPTASTEPHAVFVNAMDSEPHAPNADVLAFGREKDLEHGLAAVSKLTSGATYLCRAPGSAIHSARERIEVEEFDGPHPAGTVGVHIHWLAPVDRGRVVWYLGIQDVLAIGHLFRTGELDVSRVVSLAGPAAARPRLIQTRLGACVDALSDGELAPDVANEDVRVLSGSVLSGRVARGEIDGYLGRYHAHVAMLREGGGRRFLGWLAPGSRTFSALPVFASRLFGGAPAYEMTTSAHGERRAIIPIGVYERVLPMEILPTPLLRALMARDTETAEALGCLELEEEDLALCTFVCPGKVDYGPLLRETLDQLMELG